MDGICPLQHCTDTSQRHTDSLHKRPEEKSTFPIEALSVEEYATAVMNHSDSMNAARTAPSCFMRSQNMDIPLIESVASLVLIVATEPI